MKTSLSAASKPDEPALVTSLVSRRLAQPLALAAVRCGIPANAVTVAGGLCWVTSLALPPLVFAVAAGKLPETAVCPIWLAAAFLWCAGYILDVADGSVARMTGTSSRAGFYLDYVFHLLFKPAFLFSVGLGLFATWLVPGAFGPAAPAVLSAAALAAPLLAVLSIPANGAAEMCAAERALCDEVARRHLRMDGAAAPALWLGSDAVAAPAARKRGSFRRAAKTLAAEVASYYLQGPFFAALVAADCLLAAATPVRCFPLASSAFVLLCLVLILRIPLRFRREWRRLGGATRCGRAGRVASGTAVRVRVLLAVAPAAAPVLGPGAVTAALAAGWALAALLEAAAASLSRRAGDPIHNRYLAIAAETAWLPAGAASAVALALAVRGNPALLAFAPLVAIAAAAAEANAAAHVFCQDIGKGRLAEGTAGAGNAAAAIGRATAPAAAVRAAKGLYPAALAIDAALARTGAAGLAVLSLSAVLALSLAPRIRRTMRVIGSLVPSDTPGRPDGRGRAAEP